MAKNNNNGKMSRKPELRNFIIEATKIKNRNAK